MARCRMQRRAPAGTPPISRASVRERMGEPVGSGPATGSSRSRRAPALDAASQNVLETKVLQRWANRRLMDGRVFGVVRFVDRIAPETVGTGRRFTSPT